MIEKKVFLSRLTRQLLEKRLKKSLKTLKEAKIGWLDEMSKRVQIYGEWVD